MNQEPITVLVDLPKLFDHIIDQWIDDDQQLACVKLLDVKLTLVETEYEKNTFKETV